MFSKAFKEIEQVTMQINSEKQSRWKYYKVSKKEVYCGIGSQ